MARAPTEPDPGAEGQVKTGTVKIWEAVWGEAVIFPCTSASLQTQACPHMWALKGAPYLRCKTLFADFYGRPNS